MRGRFVTFEGGEGTGKSTQASMLVHRLKGLGLGTTLTREPGGSAGAEAIRHVLLSGAAKPLGPAAEAILFAAARDDHVSQVIKPALDRGKWVVCDRFADSTRIYQGVVGNVDRRFINGLERITIGNLKPDLTFVLDVPAELGLERVSKRRGGALVDRFETETLEFHRKLRDAYRELASNEPLRCALIDARGDRKEVAEQIWSVVNDRLDPATAPLFLGDVAS